MSFQTICTYVWTRTSRRSPPLYAMTLRFFVRRGRISAHPLCGQTGGLYPHPPLLSRTFCLPGCKIPPCGLAWDLLLKVPALIPLRWNFSGKQKTRLQKESGFLNFELLNCDLCASCFESCLCLICCLLVDLLKKCCRCCINEILSFLKTKCRVEVTYFLDNRNLL